MAYAAQQDVINVGFPATSFGTVTPAQVAAILQSVSDRMDGYFRGRWGYSAVPLVAWDEAVTETCAQIGAYRIAVVRGFNPGNKADKVLADQADAGWAWCLAVQHQQAHPLVTLANANAPGGAQPILSTKSVVNLSNGWAGRNRGW